MNAADILAALLRGQREHDERAHRDVYYLSYPQRLTHLTLHLAKYAARLNSEHTLPAVRHRTLIDAFLISLSAAELLRLDVPLCLTSHLMTVPVDLRMLAQAGFPDCHVGFDGHQWFLAELTTAAGDCAKALESLDHLEDFPYRSTLETAFVRLLKACVLFADLESVDLASAVPARWREFERTVLRGGLK